MRSQTQFSSGTKSGAQVAWGTWINTGQPFDSTGNGDPGLIAMDVNGDGKADLVQQMSSVPNALSSMLYLKVYTSTGTGFSPSAWMATNQGFYSTFNGPGLIAMDVNGDGKVDLVQQWNRGSLLWLLPLLSTGTGFTPTAWYNTGADYASGPNGTPGLIAMDFNGDGKADLVQQWNNGGTLYLLPYLSTGSGFQAEAAVNTLQGFASASDNTPDLLAMDVNGDGKVDLVQQWNNNGKLWLLPLLSTGTGFAPTAWISTTASYNSGPGQTPGLRSVDLNGDGKVDLLQQWNNDGVLWFLSYYSTGSGFSLMSGLNTNQDYASTPNGTPGVIGAGNYLNPVNDVTTAYAVGGEQTVYQYASQRCDDNNFADTPTRAFRDANGNVQMTISSSYSNRRLSGPNLNTMSTDCGNTLLVSAFVSDPSVHREDEWIHGGVYSMDGNTVYALVHNEYHGFKFPTYCDHSEWQTNIIDSCWKTSTTLAISTDGGKTYNHPTPYDVAWPSYAYNMHNADPGLSAPSNIVKSDKDGYYYATIWAWNQNSVSVPIQTKGMCVIRTQNLADATSWRAWDGSGFNQSFYPGGAECAPVASQQIPFGMMPTQVVYSRFFNQFMLIGYTNVGVYFLLSSDLIHWGSAKPIKVPWAGSGTIMDAYAAIFDDTDTSRNFERPGKNAYLYYTRFNSYPSNDRDLVRVPITFENAP